jgi:hypothetical protein
MDIEKAEKTRMPFGAMDIDKGEKTRMTFGTMDIEKAEKTRMPFGAMDIEKRRCSTNKEIKESPNTFVKHPMTQASSGTPLGQWT